jgi:hypothetical protein
MNYLTKKNLTYNDVYEKKSCSFKKNRKKIYRSPENILIFIFNKTNIVTLLYLCGGIQAKG